MWAPDEEDACRTASTLWPSGALGGNLNQELPTPEQFEAAVELVTEGDVAERVVCVPDPARHLEAIRLFEAAGFDHVYGHQIGPD